MGQNMVYHSQHSAEFAGLRTGFRGRKQVVCGTKTGNRVLIDICDPSASEAEINEALREGICERNVLGGIISALKARNIRIDIDM